MSELVTDPLLCDSAARLLSFAHDKDSSVKNFVEEQELENLFQLPLSVEAYAELVQLQSRMNASSLSSSLPDGWSFAWNTASYKPKDFYRHCFRNITPPPYLTWIWRSRCTMKHRVFTWLMMVDRINTRDMLRRRNFNVGGDLGCLLCDAGSRETRNHLLFECSFAVGCWLKLDITWDIDQTFENMLMAAKNSWSGRLFTEAVILSAWNIWKIRNRKLFDGVPPETAAWNRQLALDLDILGCRVKDRDKEGLKQLIAKISQ